MTPLVLAVALAATYSLTMLVTCDKITERPRQWLLAKISGHGYAADILAPLEGIPTRTTGYLCGCQDTYPSLEELLDHIHDAREELIRRVPQPKAALLLYLARCPWCASIYIAAPVLWSAWCFGTRAWWFVPAAALAARAVTGSWARVASPGH